ncbi:MAG: N-formylglutamate amidohydrolase [Sphingomicrobium sp.]
MATAIHDGHDLRPEIKAAMVLEEGSRLREEDPFTGQSVMDVPAHVIVHRSRFEFDLNRNAENAVYETVEQSWGLKVWRGDNADPALSAASLALHAEYYRSLAALLDGVAARHPRFVLIDVHSYNHRRDGPDGTSTPQDLAPDINIGTFSMPRQQWAFLLDPLMDAIRQFDFNGRRLDVRENVAFQGKGEQTRFVHDRYPGQACAIALEFKKFFMDEWTGEPNPAELDAMRKLIKHIADRAEALLGG